MMSVMADRVWTTAQLRAELGKYHQELLAAGNHRPSTIATYIQHPERFIAYLEGSYDPRQPQGRNAPDRRRRARIYRRPRLRAP